MTQAICFSCGKAKFGAFLPCESCGAKPTTRREFAVSLLLSDHHSNAVKRATHGARLDRGEKIALPEEVIRQLFPSNVANLTANLEPRQPRKRKLNWIKEDRYVRLLWLLVTQGQRDKHAATIPRNIGNSTNLRYAIYLRAFADDVGFQKTVEQKLAMYLGFRMPLVCLSNDRLHVGSARIRTDDHNWRGIFQSLLEKTSVIFIPTARIDISDSFATRHRSLTDEIINLIEDKYLGRTVMIQPHSMIGFMQSSIFWEKMKAEDPDMCAYLMSKEVSLAEDKFIGDVGWADMRTTFSNELLTLDEPNVRMVEEHYSSFVGVEPPHPSDAMALVWRIMFDPKTRKEYSL